MDENAIIMKAVEEFDGAASHLADEFSRLQVGRASAALIEDIPVDVYGSRQALKSLASISVPDPRSLLIQPWDKSNLGPIEKGIVGVGLGLNPINDGSVVRINIPPLTEERRADLAKRVRQLGEDAKIAVRNARQDAHNAFKKMKADNLMTEDDLHGADKKLQAKVDDANKKIEDMVQNKDRDIMTI